MWARNKTIIFPTIYIQEETYCLFGACTLMNMVHPIKPPPWLGWLKNDRSRHKEIVRDAIGSTDCCSCSTINYNCNKEVAATQKYPCRSDRIHYSPLGVSKKTQNTCPRYNRWLWICQVCVLSWRQTSNKLLIWRTQHSNEPGIYSKLRKWFTAIQGTN